MSSATNPKEPRTFTSSMELLRAFAEKNATVNDIANSQAPEAPHTGNMPSGMEDMVMAVRSAHDNSRVINQLSDALADLNVHKMVPMMVNSSKANIAVALYAEDGIVAKLTTHRFMNHDLRPHAFVGAALTLPDVLPPIYSNDVGKFSLELFPWVDRHGVNAEDMVKLKERLAKSNMKFKKGDDRLDNIGLLPGATRRAVVLDTDAVEIVDEKAHIPTQNIREWEAEIHKRFSPLFTTDVTKLVSKDPDFTEKFSPLIAQERSWSTRPPGPSGKPGHTDTRPGFH